MNGPAVLRVRWAENGPGQARYSYELRDAGGGHTSAMEQEYSVDVHATWVRDLVAEIDDLVGRSLDQDVDHRAALTRLGRMLHHTLLPSTDGYLPDLVKRVAGSSGPLLIRTNEALIPWELIHDGTGFLSLSRDVGRQSTSAVRVADGRGFTPIRRALIVADPLGDLAAARQEADRVARLLRGRGAMCTVLAGAEATLLAVMSELLSGVHDLLHYCGHVASGHPGADGGLVLHRRELLDKLALNPVAMRGAPPLVFINGCASAGASTAGLCRSFMEAGAKAVIGTRHVVEEVCARDFADGFYAAVLDGTTAGAAVRQARTALLHRPSAAWASFALYGDPSLCVGVPDRAEPGPEPVPNLDPNLDPKTPAGPALAPDAARLVARLAGGTGPVCTLHLLLALLTSAELRPVLLRRIGDTRLGMLVELVEKLIPAATAGPGDARIDLSDTVRSILAQAAAAAGAQGRPAATVADLAAAYVHVGGGSSTYLLELCGFAPSILDPAEDPDAGAGADPATGADPDTDIGLFDDQDRLRLDRLDPQIREALRVAVALARSEQMPVSTVLVLLALGLTGDPALRRALSEQGAAGAAALKHLMPPMAGPRARHFSVRTREVLDLAAADTDGRPIDTAALLRRLLADPRSTARRRLEKYGIDVTALLRSAGAAGPVTATGDGPVTGGLAVRLP